MRKEKLSREGLKILTGGSGFIGGHLANRLKEDGYRLQIFDLSYGDDVKKKDSVIALPKAGVVFHLAAMANVPFSFDHPHEVLETNIIGALNVLEYCRLKGAKMIFPSTAYVYGKPQNLPIDENHPTDAPNAYVESKIAGERLCQLYARCFNTKTIVLRFFNVYGPGQSEKAVIPEMIASLLKENVIFFKDGSRKRDFIFIDDVIEALLTAASYESKNGFEVFNIGFGKSYSVTHLAKVLRKVSGLEGVKIEDQKQGRPGDVKEVYADISKARRLLGWVPKTSLEEGLRKTFLAMKEPE